MIHHEYQKQEMADLDENAIELTELEKLKRWLKETAYDGPE